MKCWNCLKPAAKEENVCIACGQALKPNPMQATNAKSRLEYLLHESSEWRFLPPEVRQALARVYEGRLDRLETTGTKAAKGWPESDFTDPLLTRTLLFDEQAATLPRSATEPLDQTTLEAFLPPTAQPVAPLEALPAGLAPSDTVALGSLLPEAPDLASSLPVTAAAPPRETPIPATDTEPLAPLRQAALERLTEPAALIPEAPAEADSLADKIMAEADIRWFHSLGALLVVAAVVGWLRATWDGYGKNLAGLMILLSPAALHGVAYSMRRTVPISSRLLAILAGLLTAPALLAVEIFDFLPPAVPTRDYWTFAFLVSGSLLAWQAQAMKEKVPLFVSALCLMMAGWSQGPLVTSAICLMVGFALGPIKIDPNDSPEERQWKGQVQKVGFAAGVFGCFASLFLFHPQGGSLKPLLGFAGALIYLHLPTLTGQREGNSENRVVLQAAISVLGILLMRTLLDVPASGVGLFTLMASALFLSARPEDENGIMALRIGSGLGLLGMFIGFFTSTPIPPGMPHSNPAETVMRFALSLVGAALFAYLSRQTHLESQAPMLGVAAMFSTFGGWYHLFLLACTPINGSYFAQNGQLAPLFASFGLWVMLWLVGSRWLRASERGLVEAVCLPVLAACTLACLTSGLNLGPVGRLWAPATLWLGAVALAWERGLLAPRRISTEQAPDQIAAALGICLPRLALWALVLGAVFTEVIAYRQAPLPVQVLCLLLMLSPATLYRQPALEMVWLVAPAAFAYNWSQGAFPGQLVVLSLLFIAGWAASPRTKAASLCLSAGIGFGVVLGCLASTTPPAHLALLLMPLIYALCVAMPVPGRGPWSPSPPAQHGFDLMLNCCLFFPLKATVAPGTPLSFVVVACVPVLAYLLGLATQHPLAGRFLSRTSPYWLLLVGFWWSLTQGPQEAGLLLLVASGWAMTLKEDAVRGLPTRDMANGLAILGASWLSAQALDHPNALVMASGVLISECLALASSRWRPNLTNTAFLVLLLALTARLTAQSPECIVTMVAGLVAAVRGLGTASLPTLAAGTVVFLKFADGQLATLDASFKVRMLPAAVVLIVASFWLLMRPEHPSREKLGFHPMASLRLGIALLAVPALCTLAVFPTISDFAWVLAVGCSCLALSQGFGGHEELRVHLKQAGGYVLTGWAAVSLGRAAMALPWQLATLVVGLVMVAVGVKVEKNRKKSDDITPDP